MIPRVIHQTWKDHNVPARFLDAQRSWKEAHPDWEYRFFFEQTPFYWMARALHSLVSVAVALAVFAFARRHFDRPTAFAALVFGLAPLLELNTDFGLRVDRCSRSQRRVLATRGTSDWWRDSGTERRPDGNRVGVLIWGGLWARGLKEHP